MSDRGFQYYLYNNHNKEFLEIKDGTVCGRLRGDIQFPDDDLISRRHCQFNIVGNEIYIEDLDSTNRTRVNTVPILPKRRRRIRLHDVVEIGHQRLILTNQNRHEPPNTQDRGAVGDIYKAVKKGDGSLTTYITGLITKRTMILLDRAAFRRLRIKRRLKPVQKNYSTLLLSFLFSIAWALLIYGLHSQGVFDSGLPHDSHSILMPVVLLAIASTLFATAIHHMIVRTMSAKVTLRRFVVGVSLIAILLGTSIAARNMDLLTKIQDNVHAHQCILSPSAPECQNAARDQARLGKETLPSPSRKTPLPAL